MICCFVLHRKEWKIQNALPRVQNCMISRRNSCPTTGPVRFSITMKVSWNSMSPTSNFSSIVLLRVSNYPLATIICEFGGGPSRIIDCGESKRIFRMSISGIAQDNAPVSIRSSMIITQSPLGNTTCVSCICG